MGDKKIAELDTDEMLSRNGRAFSNLRSLLEKLKAVVRFEERLAHEAGNRPNLPTRRDIDADR